MSIRATSEATWIDSALLYAGELGWQLVPFHRLDRRGECTCGDAYCTAPGDHPRFTDYLAEASAERQTVRSWEPLWEEARLGAVCGPRSDLVVLEASPWAVDPEGIADIDVAMTLVDGEVVYRREE